MIDRLIDDVRLATGLAARRTFFVAAVAISLFVTTAFLCAAAFVFVLERYGLVEACLTGAAIFFVVTMLSASSYLAMKGGVKRKIEKDVKAAPASFAPNPMMLAAGLQVVRAIGIKRLLPILAIGGVILGVVAAKGLSSGTDDEAEES